jgi:hypothetical protein
MWTWTIIIGSLASIALADRMARIRGRSLTVWFWIAFLVGPLAPLALLILGAAKHPAPASWNTR